VEDRVAERKGGRVAGTAGAGWMLVRVDPGPRGWR